VKFPISKLIVSHRLSRAIVGKKVLSWKKGVGLKINKKKGDKSRSYEKVCGTNALGLTGKRARILAKVG